MKTINSYISISSVIFALSLVATPIQSTRAGAWTQPEGGMFFRLANKVYFADHFYSSGGNRLTGDWWDDSASFREISFNLIAEYGVLDSLTLTLENTLRLMNSSYSSMLIDDQSVNGISDLILGARYGILQGAFVLALEAKAEIPTGYSSHTDKVRLGNGNLDGTFKLLLGGGLPLGFGNYIDAAVGFRVRGGPYDNDVLASVSIGAETFENLWLRVGTSGVFHLGEGNMDTNGFVENLDASYLGVGGAVTYLFDFGLGIEVAGSADVWGKNTFSGWGLELVVQYQFRPDAD